MNLVNGVMLPDDDTYFPPFYESGEGFQLDRLHKALSFVTSPRIALDAGAHIGDWAGVMADKFEHVHCFEACRTTYACLTYNLMRRNNVSLHYKALGGGSRRMVSVKDPTRVGNTGANYVKAPVTDAELAQSVPMVTIDSLNLKGLDFLKLDIEGSELDAIKGGLVTILKFRPVIFIEVKKGMSERFGGVTGDTLTLLEYIGAKPLHRIKNDYIYGF